MGYGGMGYGGMGYYGSPYYGYGVGVYPGYGYGNYPGRMGFGLGYSGYGAYGYGIAPYGYANPIVGAGLTPLGIQSALIESELQGSSLYGLSPVVEPRIIVTGKADTQAEADAVEPSPKIVPPISESKQPRVFSPEDVPDGPRVIVPQRNRKPERNE